jgi:hypothetical protein
MLKFNKVSNGAIDLPADLRDMVGRWKLASMALEAVQTVMEQSSLNGPVNHQSIQARHRMLLTLLAYCYAAGLYGSEDVESATRRDCVIKYLCANEQITWNELRAFRRQQRSRLCQTLVVLLEKVSQHRPIATRSPAFDHYRLLSPAVRTAFLLTGSGLFHDEAERRLLQAIQIDSMTMDE